MTDPLAEDQQNKGEIDEERQQEGQAQRQEFLLEERAVLLDVIRAIEGFDQRANRVRARPERQHRRDHSSAKTHLLLSIHPTPLKAS